MTWTPPTHLEEYRILRPLGRGAMGEVFLARDTLLARDVAIKFVGATDVSDGVRERFYTEARAIARLSHPNVVAVHRVGEVLRRPYLVSEFVDGTSLDRVGKPLPWERVLALAIGIARGLAAAHERDVLHRDLKPANIIITAAGEAKLLDFGLAKLIDATVPAAGRPVEPSASAIDATADATPPLDATVSVADRPRTTRLPSALREVGLTATGALVGTPLYLAPELWCGAPASTRSDIYAIGVLLHELLVGRAPHAGSTAGELARTVQTPAESIATRVAGLPSRFAELVDACLALAPERRPRDGADLLARLERLATRPIVVEEGASPYRGLFAFDAEQRAFFHGRNGEIRAICEQLRRDRFVVVAGDSGAGKSSVCRAGVLPALQDEDATLRVQTILPGDRPCAALDRVVLEPTAIPTIVFVDQLEELLTVADLADAEQFARRLVALADHPHVRVLATARSDFLGRLAGLEAFETRLARSLVLLGPLSRRGLREAIVEPARSLGFEVAPALVESLVEQGRSLPLLQFALQELWEGRDEATRTLPAQALAELGGVGGALARHADRVMTALGDRDREIAWRVLVRAMTAEGTRAVLTRGELGEIVGDVGATERVIERLVAARLLVVSAERDDRVEVAHEALFTQWPRLVEWQRAHERDLRFRDQVAETARRWHQRGRPRGLLWRDDALVEYRAWRRRFVEELTDLERAFGEASEREARRVRRIRTAVVASVITGLTAAALLLLAADRRSEHARAQAERERRLLLADQGLRELAANRSSRALPYLVDVLREGGDTPALRFAIAEATRDLEREQRVLVASTQGVQQMAQSSDGSRLVISERLGTLHLFDGAGQRIASMKTPSDLHTEMAFTSDAAKLVAIGSDRVARVFTGDGKPLHERAFWPGVHDATTIWIKGLAVNRDASKIATIWHDGSAAVWMPAGDRVQELPPAGRVGSCIAFDPSGHELFVGFENGQLARWTEAGLVELYSSGRSGACHLAFGHDGRMYFAAGGALSMFERRDSPPTTIGLHGKDVRRLELSRDGKWLVTASYDGSAKVLDASNLAIRAELAEPTRWPMQSAHFDPSGDRVVTVGFDYMFRVWDVKHVRQIMTFEAAQAAGHARSAMPGALAARFTADGRRLTTVSGVDAKQWDVARTTGLAHDRLVDRGGLFAVRWSPDERTIVATGEYYALLVDVATGRRLPLDVPKEKVWDASWTSDGRSVAVGGTQGLVRTFSSTGAVLQSLVGHRGTINDVEVAPGDTLLASAGGDRAIVWDLATGRLVQSFAPGVAVLGVSWFRDARRLATASYDGRLQIWDTVTGRELRTLSTPNTQFLALAISPDERRIATAGHDSIVLVWDLATGERRALVGHTGPVTGVAWSPDGGRLATCAEEGGVVIWDPDSGRTLARRDKGRAVFSVQWSRDGSRLLAADLDRTIDVWDVAVDRRPLEALVQLTEERVPWRLVEGRLVPRL